MRQNSRTTSPGILIRSRSGDRAAVQGVGELDGYNSNWLGTHRGKSEPLQHAAGVLLEELRLRWSEGLAPSSNRAVTDKASFGGSFLWIYFLFGPHFLDGIVGDRALNNVAPHWHAEEFDHRR